MRVYFEKPRTTVGWKGLINDPYLDESYRINEGLRIARQLLLDINRLGVPAGSEFLDMISPQYIGDLIAWGAIGARTTESQVHRELASGLSAPVGFKNGTDGNIKIAIDAIQAAARPHHFLSVHKNGQVAIVETARQRGLPRHPARRQDAELRRGQRRRGVQGARGGQAAVHADDRLQPRQQQKKHERQVDVARDVADQVASGNRCIFGVMVESHLKRRRAEVHAGKDDPAQLEYGKSITDGCIGWDDSVGPWTCCATRCWRAAQRRQRRSRRPPLDRAASSGFNRTMNADRPDRRRLLSAASLGAVATVALAGRRLGARPAGDDRRPVLSVARLPRPLARLGRRPHDRPQPRSRRAAAAAGARRAPRPARRRSATARSRRRRRRDRDLAVRHLRQLPSSARRRRSHRRRLPGLRRDPQRRSAAATASAPSARCRTPAARRTSTSSCAIRRSAKSRRSCSSPATRATPAISSTEACR